jgi:hypothetical protein
MITGTFLDQFPGIASTNRARRFTTDIDFLRHHNINEPVWGDPR